MEEYCPIAVLVRNEPGVLARVAGLFARRGFNITSLAVGETDDPRVSRMSVVVKADPRTLEQVVKQLKRLVSVIRVQQLAGKPKVERGLVLIKVRADASQRAEIIQLAGVFRAHIDHVGPEELIVEASGQRDKLEALVELLRPYGIVEMARTGQIVLGRHESIDEVETDSFLASQPEDETLLEA